MVVLYQRYTTLEPYFSYPLSSELLNILKVKDLNDEVKRISMKDISCKYVRLPMDGDEQNIVIPLLHTNICDA